MNVLALVIVSLGGLSGVAALANTILGRRKLYADARAKIAESDKTDADAADVIAKAAAGLLNPLTTQLQATERRLATTNQKLDDTQREMAALREHLSSLERLLRDNGIPAPPFAWPRVGNGRH